MRAIAPLGAALGKTVLGLGEGAAFRFDEDGDEDGDDAPGAAIARGLPVGEEAPRVLAALAHAMGCRPLPQSTRLRRRGDLLTPIPRATRENALVRAQAGRLPFGCVRRGARAAGQRRALSRVRAGRRADRHRRAAVARAASHSQCVGLVVYESGWITECTRLVMIGAVCWRAVL